MKINWDRAFKYVLGEEGGYVNHPKDPGGRTNLGVTQRVWEAWMGREVTVQEMKDLTPLKVKPLYQQRYWDAIGGDFLPIGVDLVVYDYAVNSGVSRSTKTLQHLVGAEADGKLGPKTLKEVDNYVSTNGAKELINNFCDRRLKFLRGLSTWTTFGKGWSNRVARVRLASINMVPDDV